MTWTQEIDQTAAIHPHFVLTGHTWDSSIVETTDPSGTSAVAVLPFPRALLAVADRVGLSFVVIADPVSGFTISAVGGSLDDLHAELPRELSGLPEFGPGASNSVGDAPGPEDLQRMLRMVATAPVAGGVVVVDAGRWILDCRSLQEAEHSLFTAAASGARNSIPRAGRAERPTHPLVWWLCRSEYELPSWYLSEGSVRTINIPAPGLHEREVLAEAMVGAEQAREFAEQSDGLAVRDLMSVADLVDVGMRTTDAATLVRLGVVDDPWAAPDLLDRLEHGSEFLAHRVRGQQPALAMAWAAITRTLMGLSGVHRRSNGRRPRIVLFLAGPTGTGKTELAKAIAELVFGSREALIRFDMSGYSAAHSDQRLVGAPPGYTGYEAGGELTNAVRARPFSVVLFDEIEKAHELILDKFLQVLDEGQLDDGLGRRVYFDQTVVIFTSNLGISEKRSRPDGSAETIHLVDDSMPYDEIRPVVHGAISRHFKEALSRAEILNRLGDNIVVFDFLRPEAAREVFGMLIDNVVHGVQERREIALTFTADARNALQDACCDASSSFGGRGIENKVESLLVNPLSVWLFEHRAEHVRSIEVTGWQEANGPALKIRHA